MDLWITDGSGYGKAMGGLLRNPPTPFPQPPQEYVSYPQAPQDLLLIFLSKRGHFNRAKK